MRAAEEHRGYTIVETDWTTSVNVGGVEEVRPVYIIRGLKERPSRPFLTSVEECERYIDEELRAREEVDEAMSETWGCRIRSNGRASVVTVPAETMRRLGLEIGDQVTVRISRRRRPEDWGGREGKFVRKRLRPPCWSKKPADDGRRFRR